jgi:ribosomal protein L11 methyltransferase
MSPNPGTPTPVHLRLFSLLIHPTADREEYLTAELWEAGTSGIVEEDGGIRAFFDTSSDRIALSTRFGGELREEQDIDWEQASRDAWPPILVGQRFFLAPPWCTDATPEGRLRLEVHPGMACGTGRHPATQLCLQAIERFVRPGDRVLDVGTGSGILSNAATLVGAGQVVSCDVDSDAVAIARERLASPLFVGSVDAVSSSWADVILANIDSATVENLAAEFARVRKPGSRIIVSGFPEWDLPARLEPIQTLRREEWVCLII